MTERNLLIMRLLTSLERIKDECSGLGDCYIFGSILTQIAPGDIDILIVYDSNKTDLSNISVLKKKLYQAITGDLGKQIDLCTLSQSEAIQSNFIVEENCQFLFSL